MPSRPDTRRLRAVVVATWLVAALVAAWWMSAPVAVSVAADATRMRNEGRVDEAVAKLEQAGATEGQSAAVLELLGGLQRHRGRLPEAERAFRAARATGEASVEAHLGLADVLLARDARPEALATLAGLTPGSMDTAQRHRWLALIAQADDAVALRSAAGRLLASTPHDPVVLSRAFDAAERQRAWADAATIGERLIAADRANPAQWLARVAHAQEASGDLAGALARHARLPVTHAWRDRARLLQALGRATEAATLWRDHAGLATAADDRARADAYARAGWVREADAVRRATALAGRLDASERVRWAWSLNTRGRHVDAWAILVPLPVTPARLEVQAFTAGWAHADARAMPLLTDWLRTHPRDLAGWTLLAEVHRRRGDHAGRVAALRVMADLAPSSSAPAILARQLAAGGRTDAAIEAYRAALRNSPQDAAALSRELSVLYEQAGRFADALASIDQAQRLDGPHADLALREGRIRRWAGDAPGAVAALQRAVTLDARLAADRTVQADLGRALAEQRQWADAAAALDRALADGAGDVDVIRLAADVESARGETTRAVHRLQQLAAQRPLTPDERRWLAGEAEQAGELVLALSQYDALIAAAPGEAGLWQKVAELEERRGRHEAALAAWSQVSPVHRTPTYWRRVTWAARRVGVPQAMAFYEAAFEAGALDTAQCLEAARLHAAEGHASDAVRWYDRALAQSGASAAGLELEIARAHLASGMPASALAWLRQARDGHAGDNGATLLEAQALHMTGRAAEAARLLDAMIAAAPAAPTPQLGEWLAWLGRTSQARGRLLAAYEQFGGAIARRAPAPADLLLARADIAASRGDLRRAADDYGRAIAAGDERATARRDALAVDRQTSITVPAEVFWDSNGFRHASGSARVALRPSDRARVTGEWATGRVSQGTTAFERSAATVAIDRLFPTERTTLAGQVALETARGATQPLWRAQAGYEHPRGLVLQAEAFRESPWRADSWDARMRYNRITNLAAMPGDFHGTGARLSAGLPVGEHHQLQGNGAVRHFSDGNRQVQGYLQYQVPISSRQRTWVAVQPHAYVERWTRPDAAYFSPDRQVTVGATIRAIVTRGAWTLDAAATPQYLDSASREGFGYAAVASVRRDLGRMSIGASGMVFEDRKMAYRVQRVTVDVQVPVGR